MFAVKRYERGPAVGRVSFIDVTHEKRATQFSPGRLLVHELVRSAPSRPSLRP